MFTVREGLPFISNTVAKVSVKIDIRAHGIMAISSFFILLITSGSKGERQVRNALHSFPP